MNCSVDNCLTAPTALANVAANCATILMPLSLYESNTFRPRAFRFQTLGNPVRFYSSSVSPRRGCTVVFRTLEGWSILDSLYVTVQKLRRRLWRFNPQKTAGRAFATVFMLFGVGLVLYALTTAVQSIVQSELLGTLLVSGAVLEKWPTAKSSYHLRCGPSWLASCAKSARFSRDGHRNRTKPAGDLESSRTWASPCW